MYISLLTTQSGVQSLFQEHDTIRPKIKHMTRYTYIDDNFISKHRRLRTSTTQIDLRMGC